MSGRTRALLAVLSALIAPGATAPRAEAAPPAAQCAEERFLLARIRCFLDAAEAAQEVGLCETARDPTVRFQCITLYAEHRRDPGACERIAAGDPETQALRDACVAGVAIARVEPDLCEGAGNPNIRDACYAQLVLERGADPALCRRIANPMLQEACGGASSGAD